MGLKKNSIDDSDTDRKAQLKVLRKSLVDKPLWEQQNLELKLCIGPGPTPDRGYYNPFNMPGAGYSPPQFSINKFNSRCGSPEIPEDLVEEIVFKAHASPPNSKQRCYLMRKFSAIVAAWLSCCNNHRTKEKHADSMALQQEIDKHRARDRKPVITKPVNTENQNRNGADLDSKELDAVTQYIRKCEGGDDFSSAEHKEFKCWLAKDDWVVKLELKLKEDATRRLEDQIKSGTLTIPEL